jgi:hypothetical protein
MTLSNTVNDTRSGKACGMYETSAARSAAGMTSRFDPSIRALPFAGSKPAKALNKVVLPAAFGPTKAATCPALIGANVKLAITSLLR